MLGGRPYHPHAHGLVEAALQGGASGAIIVEGIQTIEHAVAGLRQKILVIRDQNVAGNPTPGRRDSLLGLERQFRPDRVARRNSGNHPDALRRKAALAGGQRLGGHPTQDFDR